jgi:cell division protein FtsW
MTKRQINAPGSRLGLTIIFLILIICLWGVVTVYNASVVEAYRDFGDKYHFATQQLKWLGLGIALFFIAAKIPLSWIRKFSLPLLIFSLFLMLIVLIPGVGGKVMGARRWINLAGFTLQPSELMKLSLIIYLSFWLEKPRPVGSFLLLLGAILGLTMLQPDLGTAIILASTGFIIYYLSGAPLVELLLIGLGGALSSLVLIFSSAYRKARVLTYLDPTKDPLGTSYHINQVLLALGSGGWLGVGLGRSRQKYEFLPEATTDSIFAVLGEEIGFLGSLVIIALLITLCLLILKTAIRSHIRFNQLLAGGIGVWLGSQTLLNLAAMVALVPLTGIPLPLISYGGSSLVTILTGLGLIINIVSSEKL